MSLLEVSELTVFHRRRGGRITARDVAAVDRVSFSIEPGECVGLVGESGCGKSSLCLSLMGIHPMFGGRIIWDGAPLTAHDSSIQRRSALGLQMVFQDPGGSLNPRMRIGQLLHEALGLHGKRSAREREIAAHQLLEQVGLSADAMKRFPHTFSGGQKQRLGLARALAVDPRLLMADEPVSALDVCVQAQVLTVLRKLQKERRFALLFVAHDLAVVRVMCTRALVMHRGRLVEMGPSDLLFTTPFHPYTRALLDSVPDIDRALRRRSNGDGAVTEAAEAVTDPNERNGAGCAYCSRCPMELACCAGIRPPWREVAPDRFVACHATL